MDGTYGQSKLQASPDGCAPMRKFVPDNVYYEPAALSYPQGAELVEKYRALGIPCRETPNHNNIPEQRARENKEFPRMKRDLIIGVRKTLRYVPNAKTSDFLVPYTSSGCTAMCLYCYLVCHYNKCAYLRLFVNREEMLARLIKKAAGLTPAATFEIGSNSDLILENTLTGNLDWTIARFGAEGRGRLTLPTKFHMVDSLLPLPHCGKTVIRMSVNPPEIIRRYEPGTSPLDKRVQALNALCQAGYPVGILIAPVILVADWKAQYKALVEYLADTLDPAVREGAVLEIIFMTYSFVHRAINADAFPSIPSLYDPELMKASGRGKYFYRDEFRASGGDYLRGLVERSFPGATIAYIA